MSLVCSSEIPECSDSGMKNFAWYIPNDVDIYLVMNERQWNEEHGICATEITYEWIWIDITNYHMN